MRFWALWCQHGARRRAWKCQRSINRPLLALEPLEARFALTISAPLPSFLGDAAHIHPSLQIFLEGQPVTIPAGVGITATKNYNPHTHDFTGKLHIGELEDNSVETPSGIGTTVRNTTLQDFFDVWRTVDGQEAGKNPSAIFDTNPSDGAPRIMDKTVDAGHVLRMYVKEKSDAAPELEYASNQTSNDLLRPELYVPRDGDQIIISYDRITQPVGAPSFAAISDQTVLDGAPTWLGIDGFSPNGGALSYTVSVSNPGLLQAIIPSGNKNLKLNVTSSTEVGYGAMTFQLFDNLVPDISSHIEALVNKGDFNSSTSVPDGFYRIADASDGTGLLVQGGPHYPSGVSSLGTVDDEFSPDLQFTGAGLLAMAKSGEDGNDAQILVTGGPARSMDFDNSIFGVLTQGDAIRQAIQHSRPAGDGPPSSDITISTAQIVADTQNAALELRALNGASGQTDVTLTVANAQGQTFSQTFHVTIVPDASDPAPYLNKVAVATGVQNQPITIQLSATDVQNKDTDYFDATKPSDELANYSIDVDHSTGLVTLTPPTDFIGTFHVVMSVRGTHTRTTLDQADTENVTVAVRPAAPAVALTPASDTGISQSDDITNASSLVFQISGATKGAMVQLLRGSSVLAHGTASGTSLKFTVAGTKLGEGTSGITATQTINGLQSPTSPLLNVTYDTTTPTFTSTPPTLARVGQDLDYHAAASDGEVLRYSLIGAPPGATIDASSGILTWTPENAGLQSLSVVAMDVAGNKSIQPVNITVAPNYTYAYGAAPLDTGEYMLGDVAVNVVLMESDSMMAPYDNNAASDPVHPGHGLPVEDWTMDEIATVKSNIAAGLQWWKDTLANMFPNAPPNLLSFDINWQYADSPIHTGYEPIARPSNDFARDSFGGSGKGWIYDFLHQVHFDATGDFSTDIRAFNDYTRQQAGTDWATTIFVINDANDTDHAFAPGGDFQGSFAFPGGRFEVVPASRPAASFAHETGHQFWALDEYASGDPYTARRGYYNTPNANSLRGQSADFVQTDTIMSSGQPMQNSYRNHTVDQYTMAAIGWRDSDKNGIFDVLDVPFTLSGLGQFNGTTGKYQFRGSTHVNALPNENSYFDSSGTQDDIQIDQVSLIEASFDDGTTWQTVASYQPRTYSTDVSLDIAVAAGVHDIWLRSRDVHTGVISNVVKGNAGQPTQDDGVGVGGMVFVDHNTNGILDAGDQPRPNVQVEVTDQNDAPLNLAHVIEAKDYTEGTVIDSVPQQPGVTVSVVGARNGDVVAVTNAVTSAAGKVFGWKDSSQNVSYGWDSSNAFRADFKTPVSTVSLRAYGSSSVATSFGRLDAYNAAGNIIARFSTDPITADGYKTMTVSRAQGDIAYVLAYGRGNTKLVLDMLQWGPSTAATTDSHGTFSLDGLPDGAYRVHVSVPPGYTVEQPAVGFATIYIASGRSTGSVNFAVAPPAYPFHDYVNPYLVKYDPANPNARTVPAPVDLLLIVYFLNTYQYNNDRIPLSVSPDVVGYVDVIPDGICAPNDLAAVVSYLNSHAPVDQAEGESALAAYIPPIATFTGTGSNAANVPRDDRGDLLTLLALDAAANSQPRRRSV